MMIDALYTVLYTLWLMSCGLVGFLAGRIDWHPRDTAVDEAPGQATEDEWRD